MPDFTPIPGFYFSVVFEIVPIFPIDVRFQSVTGLKATLETEPYREGGQNRFVHDLPVKTGYSDLVLKRSLTADLSSVRLWCTEALENFNFQPANIMISLLNEKSTPVKVWQVIHAIPLSLEISDFNAEESKLAIETLTLKYQYFKEIPVPVF